MRDSPVPDFQQDRMCTTGVADKDKWYVRKDSGEWVVYRMETSSQDPFLFGPSQLPSRAQ